MPITMHRNRILRSSGTGLLPIVLCLLAAVATPAAAANNSPLTEPPPEEQTTIAPLLTVGDAYTLAVNRGGAKQSFGGNLAKATDHWIVLRRIASGKTDYNVPILSQLPKLGTAFRRTHSGMIEEDLWIPRDAAEIESHIRVANGAKMKPIPGTAPPTRLRCA